MSKSITFDRPAKPKTPESWVLAKPKAAGENTKRLTFDIPETMHRRIKLQCVVEGVHMADVIRELIEQRFPKGAK